MPLPSLQPQTAFVCLVPVYNDWESACQLLADLGRVAERSELGIRILLVDDGSNRPCPRELLEVNLRGLEEFRVLHLRCNLGHQRAIAVGLSLLAEERVQVPVVVMDGDGEDQPEHAPHLVEKLLAQPETAVVFGARTRRLESWRFQAFYHIFRFVHWVLTGIAIRFGNFSAISPNAIQRITMSPDLWNHYAAAVLNSRLSFDTIPLPKGPRYHGRSQMRFSTLVAHGLSGISVFNEVMTARLLFACGAAMAILVALLFGVVAIRLSTNQIPTGWASLVGVLLVVLLTQIGSSLLVLTFAVLGSRSARRMIPRMEASMFVERVETLFGRGDHRQETPSQEEANSSAVEANADYARVRSSPDAS